MPRVYDEDVFDIGSPLIFEFEELDVDGDKISDDFSAFKYRCVIKHTLDDDTALHDFNSEDDSDRFVIANGKLYVQALDKDESLAISGNIEPPERAMTVNSKKVSGYVYATVSVFSDTLGPYPMLHLKLTALKPA